MYAIVETGAKQYKVSKGDVFEVEILKSQEEDEVKLDKVLFISDRTQIRIGRPYIKGAAVTCKVLGERRGPKTISYKYRRRRASSRRKIGHRQNYTVLKVKDIRV